MTRPPFRRSAIVLGIAGVYEDLSREYATYLLLRQLSPESPLRALILARFHNPTTNAKG